MQKLSRQIGKFFFLFDLNKEFNASRSQKLFGYFWIRLIRNRKILCIDSGRRTIYYPFQCSNVKANYRKSALSFYQSQDFFFVSRFVPCSSVLDYTEELDSEFNVTNICWKQINTLAKICDRQRGRQEMHQGKKYNRDKISNQLSHINNLPNRQ